ncbi:MAG: transcription termination/antitermination protein NusG [Spirochaetaceae bacterium]|jgi:transcriptional antiterminator NusG|nr:transcription termination/antitermination protein NusG [Spirochaetaceae bacterium]
MAAGWYVLQVYTGNEARVEKTMRMMLASGELDKEIVRDIKTPSEDTTEVKDGKKRVISRKFLPGYMLIEMELPDNGWQKTSFIIRGIDGVTGFVGTPAKVKPRPLSHDEARGILQKAGEIKGEKPSRTRQSFNAGEQVKIMGGPFESFTGTIEEVNTEKNRLKVMVGIFGRNTPVDVDIMQVEKV